MTIRPWRSGRISALVAASLILASFSLVFLLPPDVFLSGSARFTDMVSQFIASRAFLADSLRHGQIPLWNPYVYGGQPFLGGFESAVLYPPNLLFAVMPLAPAINFSILLHLVILGWGMERWAASRGLHPGAAALAGFVAPLSGAVFPHVYAGHLSNLCTMAWAPWIFLGLESWVKQEKRTGLFLASAAICLQLLAGHIQYFFYTAVAAGIASLILSAIDPAALRRSILATAACYLAGIALGAGQLLPGLASAAEGIRQQKLDYDFAAGFSFPPENFLTLIAPGFFGNLGAPTYWGRWSLWEMSLFIGAVGPLLIAIAFLNPERKKSGVAVDLVVAGVLLVLALGANSPLFNLLYLFAPGFGHFRSWSKFIFPATLFLVIVLATGTDALLRGKSVPSKIAWAGVAAGLIAVVMGVVLLAEPELIAGSLNLIAASGESFLPPDSFTHPEFIHESGSHAGLSLALAGTILIAAGTSLLFQEKQPLLRWALPGLLVFEMIGFAAGQISVCHLSDAVPDQVRQFVAAHPGDYRVLDFTRPNNGFLLGAGDLAGNNPSVLRRYAEFINFVEGGDPDHATQFLPFKDIAPLYALLRFRYAFVPPEDGFRVIESTTQPLPHVLLLSHAQVLAGRDALFSAMRDPTFAPAKTVLLESDPVPPPVQAASGAARLVSASPDELTIEADTDQPAVLLITDLYDTNWRAEAFPDSAQQSYHLMPADYILRAVPLEKGHHHLRIVYAPASFTLGVGISALAWTIWLALLARDWRRRKTVAAD